MGRGFPSLLYNQGIKESYGEFWWDSNSNATVIETADTPILLRETSEGLLQHITYQAGITGAITAFSDGTGKVNVADTAHGLSTGDVISIRGTTNYNGVWVVTKIDDNNFSIPDTWVANDGASDWDRGSQLKVNKGANGIYAMAFTLSVSEAVPSGSLIHFNTFVNNIQCEKCTCHSVFANNDSSVVSGHSIASFVSGDIISLAVNSDGNNDITVNHGDFSIHSM